MRVYARRVNVGNAQGNDECNSNEFKPLQIDRVQMMVGGYSNLLVKAFEYSAIECPLDAQCGLPCVVDSDTGDVDTDVSKIVFVSFVEKPMDNIDPNEGFALDKHDCRSALLGVRLSKDGLQELLNGGASVELYMRVDVIRNNILRFAGGTCGPLFTQ